MPGGSRPRRCPGPRVQVRGAGPDRGQTGAEPDRARRRCAARGVLAGAPPSHARSRSGRPRGRHTLWPRPQPRAVTGCLRRTTRPQPGCGAYSRKAPPSALRPAAPRRSRSRVAGRRLHPYPLQNPPQHGSRRRRRRRPDARDPVRAPHCSRARGAQGSKSGEAVAAAAKGAPTFPQAVRRRERERDGDAVACERPPAGPPP